MTKSETAVLRKELNKALVRIEELEKGNAEMSAENAMLKSYLFRWFRHDLDVFAHLCQ